MSTSVHPQPDGHTERMNAGMEHFLRVFVNHQQDDWVQWLPLVEFAANNGPSESTQCTPFFAAQGLDPQITFVGEPTHGPDQRRLEADQVQAPMQLIHEHLTVEMRQSQVIQKEGANRERIPAHNIQVESKGWLDAQNIQTTRPIQKLDCKSLEPFQVRQSISCCLRVRIGYVNRNSPSTTCFAFGSDC
jgi:hypothetical protein